MQKRLNLARSRQELSNDYLLAKIGFDTAENGPDKFAVLLGFLSPDLGSLSVPARGLLEADPAQRMDASQVTKSSAPRPLSAEVGRPRQRAAVKMKFQWTTDENSLVKTTDKLKLSLR